VDCATPGLAAQKAGKSSRTIEDRLATMYVDSVFCPLVSLRFVFATNPGVVYCTRLRTVRPNVAPLALVDLSIKPAPVNRVCENFPNFLSKRPQFRQAESEISGLPWFFAHSVIRHGHCAANSSGHTVS